MIISPDFRSPTATNIKAWGTVSEANGTLGIAETIIPTLTASNNNRKMLVLFSDAMIFL